MRFPSLSCLVSGVELRQKERRDPGNPKVFTAFSEAFAGDRDSYQEME